MKFYSEIATRADVEKGVPFWEVREGQEIWFIGAPDWTKPELTEVSAFSLLFVYHGIA